MSYRYVFGASGVGKSYEVYKEVTAKAAASLARADLQRPERYVVLVPEQYSLQTQRELSAMGEGGGILNVDVLSFGRLTHRLFEEIGASERTVLDDSGKILILLRLADRLEEELPVLGRRLRAPGYLAELKSLLSEFMQYGIGPEDMDRFLELTKDRGALRQRLLEIQTVYRAFLRFEADHFITAEETLDLAAEAAENSAFIRDTHFILDGFTGFTPVQYRMLSALLGRARSLTFVFDLAEDGERDLEELRALQSAGEEHALFYLTRKSVLDIDRLAASRGTPREPDRWIVRRKDREALVDPALAHLERNLFRPGAAAFPAEPLGIHRVECSTREEEVRAVCRRIRHLTDSGECRFRDIAVIAGSLSDYADLIRRAAVRYRIPFYLDLMRPVRQNPMLESIRSALDIYARSFSYESVFRYLKTGLSDLTEDEVDRLENYCLTHGIHSKRRWGAPFEEGFEELRQRFLAEIAPLETGPATAARRCEALWEFIRVNRLQEKLFALADVLPEEEWERAQEYRRVPEAVIKLLDRIHALLGDQSISARDFADLLDKSMESFHMTLLPQELETVTVGDLERTRLTPIRHLFVIGADDSAIPGAASAGGLLSDLEREFLLEQGVQLSPTPRQRMFIQRLYLYLQLTKPSRSLTLSCALTDDGGEALRPSYLFGVLSRLFPNLVTEIPEAGGPLEVPAGAADALEELAVGLEKTVRSFTEPGADPEGTGRQRAQDLYAVLWDSPERDKLPALARAALGVYEPKALSPELTERLYGPVLLGSVTRLETAADCMLRHFLQYAIKLQDRREFRIEAFDIGNVLHDGLDRFAQSLEKDGLRWEAVSREEMARRIREILPGIAARYQHQLFLDRAGSVRTLQRMERVLIRTVEALQVQLKAGDFTPWGMEMALESGPGKGVEIRLADGRTMRLMGRIDRTDIALAEDCVFVKIIDYKSGARDLDMDKIREGRQLQLPVYMMEALPMAAQVFGRPAEPAALFYYHLQDPILKLSDKEMAAQLRGSGTEGLDALLMKKLKPAGLISRDRRALLSLDRSLAEGGSSQVIPAAVKMDGALDKHTLERSFDEEGYRELTETVREVMTQLGEGIYGGQKAAEPYRSDKESACRFCPFKAVCGFDPRLPGYRTKGPGRPDDAPEMDDEEEVGQDA